MVLYLGMKKIALFILLFPFFMVHAQQELPLYGAQPIPNAKLTADREKVDTSHVPLWQVYSQVSRPKLMVFLPPAGKATGAAVVICPGGGYGVLAFTHEGTDVAKMFNDMGVAAFVLKYRLPDDETMIDKSIGPLQDAQRAIQLVRQRAGEWKIDPARVGIMGFSAGGHLASTEGTHFNQAVIGNPEHISLRPDFMILLYPVISFQDSIAHKGSRENLIGKNPSAELLRKYSNELQVTSQTPPTFLVHSEDDDVVPVANTIQFYESCLHHGVPAEMHIYPKGGHGYGMNNPTTPDKWTDHLKNWMIAGGWIH